MKRSLTGNRQCTVRETKWVIPKSAINCELSAREWTATGRAQTWLAVDATFFLGKGEVRPPLACQSAKHGCKEQDTTQQTGLATKGDGQGQNHLVSRCLTRLCVVTGQSRREI